MKLYKFRELENRDFFCDIINNQRLYASEFNRLNDPMEGCFYHYGLDKKTLGAIRCCKQQYRICSLSEIHTDVSMWIFYADEGKGCCIEVEPLESPRKVHYHKDHYIKNSIDKSDTEIKKILTEKLTRWKYEKEWRILTNGADFVDVVVKRIYLGYNIGEKNRAYVNSIVDAYNNSSHCTNKILIEDFKKEDLTV